MKDLSISRAQGTFLSYTGKFAAIRGGVGSGKSHVCALWMLDRMTRFPKGQHYVIGADYPQLKRGFLITFRQLLDRAGIKYTYRTGDGTVFLEDFGATLLCLSSMLDERIRSVEFDTVLLEEPQTWEGDSIEVYRTITGRLRGSPGGVGAYGDAIQPQMRMSFNPPSKSHWLFNMIEVQWAKAGWPCWRWSVRDNYMLGAHRQAEYLKVIETSYPQERWASEIDGHWKDVGGGCYYKFARSLHCHPIPELPPLAWDARPDKPIWWTLDFNVAWMGSVMGQVHVQKLVTKGLKPITPTTTVIQRIAGPAVDGWQRRIHYALKEIFLPDAGTPDVVDRFVQNYREITGADYGRIPVYVYGDPAGGARSQSFSSSSAARSQWQIVGHGLQKARIPFLWRVCRSAPSQVDRVNAVNLQLCEGLNRGALIDESECPNFVKDLELVNWSKKSENQIDKSDDSEEGKKRTHLTDAFGYFTHTDRAQANGQSLDFPNWMER